MKEIMMLIPIVVVQKKQRAVLWEAGAGGGQVTIGPPQCGIGPVHRPSSMGATRG